MRVSGVSLRLTCLVRQYSQRRLGSQITVPVKAMVAYMQGRTDVETIIARFYVGLILPLPVSYFYRCREMTMGAQQVVVG